MNVLGKYGERSQLAKERGRQPGMGNEPASKRDEPWSRIKGARPTQFQAPAFVGEEVNPTAPETAPIREERPMADEKITTEQALADQAKWKKTFDRLGLNPIYASNIPALVLIPAAHQGRAQAKLLRRLSVGFANEAARLESAAESQASTEAKDDAADF